MPSAFSRRRVSADLDVLSEGSDIIDKQRNSPSNPQTRTLSGSQTTFTKGDPTKQTVANNYIGGDSAVTILFGIPAGLGIAQKGNHSPTPRAYAEIRWLVDGVAIKRLVSVASGEQITGVGEYVSVQIWDSTTPDSLDPAPEYDIVCLVAPGTRGSTSLPPTYSPTPDTFTLVALTTMDLSVPQDVGIRSLQVLTNNAANLKIIFKDYSGFVLLFVMASDIGTAYVDIPLGAVLIEFDNVDTMNDAGFSVTFGVSG